MIDSDDDDDAGDVDAALARLRATMLPRIGKKMTALVIKNLVDLREMHGASDTTVLFALHKTLDAYARIPESGTPFPLDVADAVGLHGCRKLSQQNARQPTLLKDVVASHADALVPAYGADDVEFAVRVAWKNAHHYFLNLVVGRSVDRNDPSPTTILYEAWQAQGARGSPLAAVPVDFDESGVIYRGVDDDGGGDRAGPFFQADEGGDPVYLRDPRGLARFFAKVPLRITPNTLAWIVHLVRIAFPGATLGESGDVADVDAGLSVEWEPKEATSIMLGLAPPFVVDERASIRFRTPSGAVVACAPGELVVVVNRA